ncbi:MAG: ABC transporter permease [Bacteroidales bacterium]|nr:ABC transporter permease [Bacteroidales bacterium]MDY3913112.1 FtsX-like permease family protein [Sodaliphilus sp.]
MKLAIKIAMRYLRSKKAHNAVNIISIISTCGVVVTTAALICVLSVFNGFKGLIMGRLAMLDPEIAISVTQGKAMADADSVIAVAQSVKGVRQAVPVVEDNALAIFADYQMPVRLRGVPDGYDRINGIDSVMVDGEFKLRDEVSRYGVIGVGPALKLHARPGLLRMVQLYAPQRQGSVNMANPMDAFRNDSVFVSGVFQMQQNGYDADLIYVPIDLARELFDYTSEATRIELSLDSTASEAAVMQQLEQCLGPAYMVQNRLMQQATAYRLVNVEKWVTFLLLAFIMIIATFNVISTLSLLIIEKDESIRTFRSLGATNKLITQIFVAEGWLIALVGAVSGVALGLALCLCQQQFGWLKMQGDESLMVVRAYPVQVEWTDVAVVFALVAAIGLLTSLVTSLTMRRRLRY